MGTSPTYHAAIVAGACFIGICLFMLTIPFIYEISREPITNYLVLTVSLALFAITFAIHLYGYTQLGKKLNSSWLVRSARAIMVTILLFEAAVMATVFFDPATDHVEVLFLNAIIGLLVTVLVAPAILFAFLILKLYKQLGIGTIAAAALTPAAVLSMWQPWPAALMALGSMYLLYRASKTQ